MPTLIYTDGVTTKPLGTFATRGDLDSYVADNYWATYQVGVDAWHAGVMEPCVLLVVPTWPPAHQGTPYVCTVYEATLQVETGVEATDHRCLEAKIVIVEGGVETSDVACDDYGDENDDGDRWMDEGVEFFAWTFVRPAGDDHYVTTTVHFARTESPPQSS